MPSRKDSLLRLRRVHISIVARSTGQLRRNAMRMQTIKGNVDPKKSSILDYFTIL